MTATVVKAARWADVEAGVVRTPAVLVIEGNRIVAVNPAVAPMKRPGRAEDIAAACSYLVSEAANYVTGHTLSVNGGRYLA